MPQNFPVTGEPAALAAGCELLTNSCSCEPRWDGNLHEGNEPSFRLLPGS